MGLRLKGMRLAALSASLVSGILVSGVAIVAVAGNQAADARLRQYADAATLAGVDALAAASTLPDTARVDASLAAVASALAVNGLQAQGVAASLETMSVEVTIDGRARGAKVISVAHYVTPGQSLAPLRSSSLLLPATARSPL